MGVSVMLPAPDGWIFVNFSPLRGELLERDEPYESIAAEIETAATPRTICVRYPQGGRKPATAGGIRCIFGLELSPNLVDRFFNGRDGYRGRYWQSEEIGMSANRALLDLLEPTLVRCAEERPHRLGGLSLDRVRASLRAASAKLWIWRQEQNGKGGPYADRPHLRVRRWEETRAAGGPYAEIAQDGAWAPYCRILDIKGGFIADDGRELTPDCKADRASQIRFAGFT